MKNQNRYKLFTLFIVLLFADEIAVRKSDKRNTNVQNEIDFEKQVKKYCMYRPRTNFCSREHIEIMLEIERRRLEKIEMERQLKRMQSEIVQKVFNTVAVNLYF
jgi:hypothetical protein